MQLYEYQKQAIEKLDSGKILVGTVGSGKTFTALSFYYLYFRCYKLIVITTAKKRDTGDWEKESSEVGIKDILVDSWNNIQKYQDYKDYFFIFDEQRVVGYGKWSKAFIKIAKSNKWILLSATPGDTWSDYIPVFIANGFYKNKTDFARQHIIYDPYVDFPKIKSYCNEGKLISYREKILIKMDSTKKTIRNKSYIKTEYDKDLYLKSLKNRWNPFEEKPIENPSQLTQIARKIVAVSQQRRGKVKEIMSKTEKLIVFYNYNYELDILESICNEIQKPYSQWNGHKHQDILKTSQWAYLVQYGACEGWNCIETNTILFFSLNYSYKNMEQAEGRIDRLNTPYENLYYYYMTSYSSIDKAVLNTLRFKRQFNESAWGKENG